MPETSNSPEIQGTAVDTNEIPSQPIEENPIPPKYSSLPSEMVEELWTKPEFIDSKKNREEMKRRESALEKLRQQELVREEQKTARFAEFYANLSPDQQAEFRSAQQDAVKILPEHLQGQRKIDDLSKEEEFITQKLQAAHERHKAANPDKPFVFELGREIDKRVLNNLNYRLAMKVYESRKVLQDRQRANDIRQNIGIPSQGIDTQDLYLPKTEARETVQDEEKRFGEFKVKNGETAPGVFWYEYANTEAKRLKEAGKFEWGKERLYFDISLDDMDTLRDLTFKVAKESRIAIRFKHVDKEKTAQINLDEPTRFVVNFATIEDAKRFYEALSKEKEYQQLKPARNIDYHGFNIDGVAHYASGYREQRFSLENIINTVVKNPDGSYTYTKTDGKTKATIAKEQYDKFMQQYQAMPNPEEKWKKA